MDCWLRVGAKKNAALLRKAPQSQGDQRGAIRQRCSEALADYFLGAAATHAPFLSAPPFGSHFIFAFTHSALVVGVGCAKAAGASSNAAITAATGRSFMAKLLSLGSRGGTIGLLAEPQMNGRERHTQTHCVGCGTPVLVFLKNVGGKVVQYSGILPNTEVVCPYWPQCPSAPHYKFRKKEIHILFCLLGSIWPKKTSQGEW
jgi:hypothetical protein